MRLILFIFRASKLSFRDSETELSTLNQNLTTKFYWSPNSSSRPPGRSCQTLRNSLEAYLRYPAEWDRRTRKHNASGHSCRHRRGIKRKMNPNVVFVVLVRKTSIPICKTPTFNENAYYFHEIRLISVPPAYSRKCKNKLSDRS